MFTRSWPRIGAWLLFGSIATMPAAAQTAPPVRPAADPANAAASAPRVVHRSALAGYKRQVEPAAQGWREANDTVGCIGSWRAYAREAAGAAGAAASAPCRAASGARP